MEYLSMLLVLAALTVTAWCQAVLPCGNQNGDFQDGNSCTTFIQCRNGQGRRRNCPNRTPFFDTLTQRCVLQQQIRCLQNNGVAGFLPGQGGFAIGQRQPAGINQLQVAGANGLQPGWVPGRGFAGQPNNFNNFGQPLVPGAPLFPLNGQAGGFNNGFNRGQAGFNNGFNNGFNRGQAGGAWNRGAAGGFGGVEEVVGPNGQLIPEVAGIPVVGAGGGRGNAQARAAAGVGNLG